MKSRSSGFTLVEIAIVLVIVGLLVGGLLKGQEIIFNSKVKATFNLSRELSAAVAAYKDRYGQLPGDDPHAQEHFPNALPLPVNGNGDGLIAYGDCRGGAGIAESCQALYELRLAGFISGTGAGPIRTPFGGWAELAQANAFFTGLGTQPAMGFHADGISYKAANAIDTAFDDASPAAGNWRCLGLATYARSDPEDPVPGWCAMQF